MIEVGMVALTVVVLPVSKNDRLLVRVMVRFVPTPAAVLATYGTVITIGDHVVGVVATDAGFKARQVAVAVVTAVPQEYPHMGTVDPSGRTVTVGAAVRLIVCCAPATPNTKRRTVVPCKTLFKIAFR